MAYEAFFETNGWPRKRGHKAIGHPCHFACWLYRTHWEPESTFHSTKYSENGDKWHRHFLGEFSQKPGIFEFPKSEQFHWKFRKFREESRMEREIPDKKNYTRNFCIPRKVGLFSFKFQIILFHSPLEISRNSTAIFHRMESARSVVEKNDKSRFILRFSVGISQFRSM